MNLNRLYEILAETTVQLRKGDTVIEHEPINGLAVTEIFDMPHVDAARPELEKIDVEFMVIGVHKVLAERRRDELVAILKTYPEPERLAGGPSYIEVGAAIGDQGAAFQLFALGKVLGLWGLVTPAMLGATGEEARKMAGSGLVMITGFKP